VKERGGDGVKAMTWFTTRRLNAGRLDVGHGLGAFCLLEDRSFQVVFITRATVFFIWDNYDFSSSAGVDGCIASPGSCHGLLSPTPQGWRSKMKGEEDDHFLVGLRTTQREILFNDPNPMSAFCFR